MYLTGQTPISLISQMAFSKKFIHQNSVCISGLSYPIYIGTNISQESDPKRQYLHIIFHISHPFRTGKINFQISRIQESKLKFSTNLSALDLDSPLFPGHLD
jgi:hypothetical protein